ncbi:hypothetical protein N1027_06180 [Herbiconiux sp. CPCC 205763]|uniref:Uncharacterized protein n=1 Tax=Herbiconiux aconitum TaxID=2970913 RepID=A0ABT2GR12_9MICO|nr:hypothetical protein [Herbiconiux aconitum]MCS5717720.1 hypothetical protein [Herbiconiux aconitum]
MITFVDISQPQNLIEAWGKNAAYHFVFTRQNRGKLEENRRLYGLRGKVAIDVARDTVAIPTRVVTGA